MAVSNYQGGADAIFDFRNINRVAERELGRKASVAQASAKAAEDQAKEIAGMVAKINPNGLRDGDIPKFSEKYGEIQNFAAKIRTAGSIEERATASAQFNQKVQEMGIFVNSSKNMAKQYSGYGTTMQGQVSRISDNQRTQYLEMNKLSTDELQKMDLANIFKLGVDPKYIDSTFKEIESGLQRIADNSRQASLNGNININGNSFTKVQNVGTVSQEQATQGFLTAYKSRDMFKDFVDDQAKAAGVQPIEYIQQLGNQAATTIKSAGDETLKETNRPRPVGSGDGAEKALQPTKASELVPIGSAGDTYEVRGMDRFSPTGFNLVGTTAYDVDNNEEITLGTVEGGVQIGEVSVKPYMKSTQISRPVYKDGKFVGRETVASVGQLAKPKFAKANPNLIEWKATAIGTYKDANGNTKNVTIPVRSLPRDKKGMNARVDRAIKVEEESNKGNTPKPASSNISSADKQAMDWLKANPKAPQANKVREMLKSKGL